MDNPPCALVEPAPGIIWELLQEVPDPEIPVVSIVELGIVREVQWQSDTVIVSVTPTYSGCPATKVIREDIVARLQSAGFDKVRVEIQLSPAWTTDWLSQPARHKLESYGIAPPQCAVHGEQDKAIPLNRYIRCPRCRSIETEKISQFGSTPCKAAYRCRHCLEPFDYFKAI